jgi:O-antigen/teichoic acid export membrane protein
MTQSTTQRIARNYSAFVIASLFSKGLLFVWQILLGNWVSVADYGIYSTVSSLMAISTSLVAFGLGMIMIREVARHPEKIGAYWTAMLYMQTVFALVSYVFILGLGIASQYSMTIIAFTALGGISLFVDMFGNVSYDMLVAQEKLTITSVIEIVHIVIRVSLAGVVLWLGYGLIGVYIVTIFSGVLRSIALNVANFNLGNRPSFPFNRELAWELLSNGMPIALSGFLLLAYQHADKLMTTAIIGESSTGTLMPAFVINFGMIELISSSLLVSVFPLLSRAYLENETTFSQLVQKLALFMFTVGLPITLGVCIFARPIILTLYNPNFTATADILAILVWSTLLTMVGNVFSRALLVQNKQRYSLLVRLFSLGVNIVLNYVFLTTFRDARGTALATVIAESSALLITLYIFHTPSFSRRTLLLAMARVALIGGLCALTMLIVGQVHFIVGGIVGVMVYALGIVYGGVLNADDWQFLRNFTQSLPLLNRFLKPHPTTK